MTTLQDVQNLVQAAVAPLDLDGRVLGVERHGSDLTAWTASHRVVLTNGRTTVLPRRNQEMTPEETQKLKSLLKKALEDQGLKATQKLVLDVADEDLKARQAVVDALKKAVG